MRHVILLSALLVCVAVTVALPPIALPRYNDMADERTLAGIPNCLNVVSNVPFAAVALAGFATIFSRRGRTRMFRDPWERWPYAVLFGGMGLTAAGSSYYHLAPVDARLVWDRIPMTIGFVGFLTAVMAERIGTRAARWAIAPLLAAGIASVAFWYRTSLQGGEDLRFYGLVQFGSLLLAVIMLALYPDPYRNRPHLFAAIGTYAAAKVFELADYEIFAAGNIVSGHTLKHLAAAAGAAIVISTLRARTRSSAFTAPRNVITAAARR